MLSGPPGLMSGERLAMSVACAMFTDVREWPARIAGCEQGKSIMCLVVL